MNAGIILFKSDTEVSLSLMFLSIYILLIHTELHIFFYI